MTSLDLRAAVCPTGSGTQAVFRPGKKAKFVRNFMAGAAGIEDAIRRYVTAVKDGSFPGPEHCYPD